MPDERLVEQPMRISDDTNTDCSGGPHEVEGSRMRMELLLFSEVDHLAETRLCREITIARVGSDQAPHVEGLGRKRRQNT